MLKKAGKFQNNLNAFSKERDITDANQQRKAFQLVRQNVCNGKLNNCLAPKRLLCKFSHSKNLKCHLRL